MSALDMKGRLFGKVSLPDLLLVSLLALLVGPPLYFAYLASGVREIEIHNVSPTRVMPGYTRRIEVRGSGFSRDSEVRLSTVILGRPAVMTPFHFESDIPENLPPGWYHVAVTGPKNTAVAILPIVAIWKPEVSSVAPPAITHGEGGTISILGKRFQENAKVRIGGIPMPDVEYVSDTLLRVSIGPTQFIPGDHPLQVIDSGSGEESDAGPYVRIHGEKTVPVVVVLSLQSVPPKQAEFLKQLHEGKERITSPDAVQFIQLLATTWEPRRAFRSNANRKADMIVSVGMVVTERHQGSGFDFEYREQKLEEGSALEFQVNKNSFSGTVLGKPVILDTTYRNRTR